MAAVLVFNIHKPLDSANGQVLMLRQNTLPSVHNLLLQREQVPREGFRSIFLPLRVVETPPATRFHSSLHVSARQTSNYWLLNTAATAYPLRRRVNCVYR